jgi:arylsulfatase A-like enzyme
LIFRLICTWSFVVLLALAGGCDASRQSLAPTAHTAKQRTSGGRTRVTTPTRPNILLITLDTLRYDQTGIGDESTNQTPFLRKLARDGVEFTNSYSTYDSTPESHFSMMTGYILVGADGNMPDQSISYQLGRLGYETFGIAANGNLSKKNNYFLKGFQHYYCLYDVWDAMSPAQKTASAASIDTLIASYGAPLNDFNRSKVYASADRVLSGFEAEISQTQVPFFGFLNFIEAHDPYFPDPRYYNADAMERNIRPSHFASDLRTRQLPPDMVDPSLIGDANRRKLLVATLEKAQQRQWQATFDLNAGALEVYKRRYRAQVREIDDAIRRVFAILAERKLLDSTIVIITSDHGESLGEQHLITHSFLNRGDREATHRVPLIMVFPAAYRLQARSLQTPTTSADLAPTIFDLVGFDWQPMRNTAPPGLYGKSLYPYLSSNPIMYSRSSVADPARSSNEDARTESRKSAEERLRALGYLR